jgi:peptidoglycan/LPS O-acetylase OafA/YrhL
MDSELGALLEELQRYLDTLSLGIALSALHVTCGANEQPVTFMAGAMLFALVAMGACLVIGTLLDHMGSGGGKALDNFSRHVRLSDGKDEEEQEQQLQAAAAAAAAADADDPYMPPADTQEDVLLEMRQAERQKQLLDDTSGGVELQLIGSSSTNNDDDDGDDDDVDDNVGNNDLDQKGMMMENQLAFVESKNEADSMVDIELVLHDDDDDTGRTAAAAAAAGAAGATTDGNPRSRRAGPRRNCCVRLLLAFSIISSLRALFKSRPAGARGLGHLDAYKVLAMLWVILGHTYNFGSLVGYDNMEDLAPPHGALATSFWFQIVPGAFFAVDVFLWMSGLLVGYIFLKRLNKQQQQQRSNKQPSLLKTLPAFYVHRVLRLFPVYFVAMMIFWHVLPVLGSGPFWFQASAHDNTCTKYWWTNFLFLNNFVPADGVNMCMGWSWYIANDFQFYAVSPFFIYLFWRHRRAGWLALLSALVASTVVIMALAAHFDSAVGVAQDFDHIYVKPYCRIQPYLVGVATAFVLAHLGKDAGRFRPRNAVLLLAAAFALLFTLVFATYGNFKGAASMQGSWSLGSRVVFLGTSRMLVGVALSVIALVCFYNRGNYANRVLASPRWIPLAKLSFSTYLLHPIIIQYVYLRRHRFIHYTPTTMMVYWLAFVPLSYACGLFLYVVVEAPLVQLEQIARGRRKPSSSSAAA